LNNPTLVSDGLWLFGKADKANAIPVLESVTVVLYLIPEPGLVSFMTVLCLMLFGRPFRALARL